MQQRKQCEMSGFLGASSVGRAPPATASTIGGGEQGTHGSWDGLARMVATATWNSELEWGRAEQPTGHREPTLTLLE